MTCATERTRGVWIPEYVMQMQGDGTLGTSEVILLAIVHSLSKTGTGCYAANDYLAGRLGVQERRIRQMVAALKEKGLLRQVEGNARKRILRTAWDNAETGKKTATPEAINCQGRGNKLPRPYILKKKVIQSGPTGADREDGFGFVDDESETDATPFDITMATALLTSCRKLLGPSHMICRRAKMRTWAHHIALLRTMDNAAEEEIAAVMEWYAENMGGPYVPEAYSGETFRKKYPAILKQAKRALPVVNDVSEEASSVASRLATLEWPNCAKDTLPVVVHVGLARYTAWRAVLAGYIAGGAGGRGAGALLRFAQHVSEALPPPRVFITEWMTSVSEMLAGWGGWNGDLARHAFSPESKQFLTLGRGVAMRYCNDPSRWDHLIKDMEAK